MRVFRVVCLLSLQSILSSAMVAGETLDLGTSGTSQAFNVPQGTLNLFIVNRVIESSVSYEVRWEIEFQMEPPLTLPGAAGPEAGATCPDLVEAVGKLEVEKQESNIPSLVEAIKREREDCLDQAEVAMATAAISSTMFSPITVELEFGSQATFTITRKDNGIPGKEWKVTYSAPRLGEWFVTYGFTFIPNNDELFVTKPVEGEEGKFEITEKENNRDFDFVPAIFYAYAPTKWKNRYLSHSLGAGLGFDLSNPVVYLGWVGTYRHNVSLTAGLTMHKQKRLAGQYSIDDPIVGEALTEDQLTEETYRPNWFVGVAFRFGSAPETHQKPKPKKETK